MDRTASVKVRDSNSGVRNGQMRMGIPGAGGWVALGFRGLAVSGEQCSVSALPVFCRETAQPRDPETAYNKHRFGTTIADRERTSSDLYSFGSTHGRAGVDGSTHFLPGL